MSWGLPFNVVGCNTYERRPPFETLLLCLFVSHLPQLGPSELASVEVNKNYPITCVYRNPPSGTR